MDAFGGKSYRLDTNGQLIRQGIEERIYQNWMPNRCSFEELCLIFDEILTKMITGWQISTLSQNPAILHTKSEEEWFLFIKPETFNEEAILYRLLAYAAGVPGEISCHNHWNVQDDANPHPKLLYLWINKKSIDKVTHALHLKLN